MVQVNSFYLFLSYLSAAMLLLPAIISVLRYKLLNKYYLTLFILLIISIITEVYSFLEINYFKQTNILLYNCYILVQGALICISYYYSSKHKPLKILSLLIGPTYTIVGSVIIFKSQNQSLNSFVFTFESIIIIVLSLMAFYLQLKHLETDNILAYPNFWFNTAFITYFTGNVFLHLFSTYLQEHALYTFYELWGLWHSLLNILFYSLISIGFWKIKTLQT
jgi:hypothetical protein